MSRPRRDPVVGSIVWLTDETDAYYGRPFKVTHVETTPFGTILTSYSIASSDGLITFEGLRREDVSLKSPGVEQ